VRIRALNSAGRLIDSRPVCFCAARLSGTIPFERAHEQRFDRRSVFVIASP
jgi:hypothetical protein